jgi:dienelactone hydrolase
MSTAEEARNRPGVVLAGLPVDPAAANAVVDRYTAHGYTVAVADVDAGGEIDAGLAAVGAAIDGLRESGARAVAVAGYDDGGRFAYLAVTRLGADGAVAFRGFGIVDHLSEARNVKAPMSLHFADDDARIPFADVRAIKGALEGFGTVEIYRYATFDARASEQAGSRAFAVLDALRARQG